MTRRNLLTSKSGNVALMFGLMLFPLLMGAGIALDLLRANNFRAQLREATDAGVLAAARASMLDSNLPIVDAEAIAQRYFDANGASAASVEILTFDYAYDAENGIYSLTVTGRVKTALMGLIGNDYVPINIVSSAKVTPAGPVEAVMVLDNTGSMSGAKLEDLKSAATMLTDMLVGSGGGKNKVALVPFAQYVDVGDANETAFWIDTALLSSDHDDDDDSNWNGCAGSRNYPLNVVDNSFVTDLVPALPDVDCPQAILPLTNNKSDLTSAIDNMTAAGWTYIATGLTWGHRVISSDAPFTEGLSYADTVTERGVKAIILLTDGQNTRSADYPFHNSESEAEANSLTTEICDNVKATGVRLYTIAFEVSDTGIKTLLSDCASSDGGYFDAVNATALNNAFSAIAVDLTDLALTE